MQTDLAQIRAIDDYQPARAAVDADQRLVAAAAGVVQHAEDNERYARYVQSQDSLSAADANARLRSLALDAYIGVTFVPTSNSSGGASTQPVSTPDGLTGIQAIDANEMLIVVGDDARRNVQLARNQVKVAAKFVQAAHKQVLAAEKKEAAAQGVLAAGQASLKVVTDAALSPAKAAKAVLPNFPTTTIPAGFTTTTTPFITVPSPFGSTTTTLDNLTATKVGTTTTSTTLSPAATDKESPTILGTPVLNGQALAAWFDSTGRQANTTVPVAELAGDYDYWGHQFGVRDDLAFAQSIIETGFFSFPAGGQLTGKDNNFAGIGACDSCTTGWAFPDAKTGVGAQIELLHAYATNVAVPNEPNFIGNGGVGGCCQTWMALAGKWASSLIYGISIMTIYNQMLTWYIPQRLVQLGLITAPPLPATGTGSTGTTGSTGATAANSAAKSPTSSTTVTGGGTTAASVQFTKP